MAVVFIMFIHGVLGLILSFQVHDFPNLCSRCFIIMIIVNDFQVHFGAKFVSGQFVCLCSDIQVLQSTSYVSGAVQTL